MALATMPEDLRAHIEAKLEDVLKLLDEIEKRLISVEAQVKATAPLPTQVRELWHDFNQVRQTVVLLVEELEQRMPVANPTKRRGSS